MFTEKEIAVYRSIKAPADLCQKIIKQKNNTRKILCIASVIAACFIIVISGLMFGFVMDNQSNIVINGEKLNDSIVFYDTSVSVGRSVSSVTTVPVEIEVSSKTKVEVSQGFISVDGSDPVNEIVLTSSKTVFWEFDHSNTDNVLEMYITDEKGVEKVTLIYDNTKITATREIVK